MSEYSSETRPKRPRATTSNFTSPFGHGMFASGSLQTNPAESVYRNLAECIFDFESNLDDDHEIGARLISFGSALTLYIQNVGCYDPEIITVSGKTETGEQLQLVQHASQLNVLLIALKKRGEEPVRIGFKLKRGAETKR